MWCQGCTTRKAYRLSAAQQRVHLRQNRPTANGAANARMGHGVNMRAFGLYSWSATLAANWICCATDCTRTTLRLQLPTKRPPPRSPPPRLPAPRRLDALSPSLRDSPLPAASTPAPALRDSPLPRAGSWADRTFARCVVFWRCTAPNALTPCPPLPHVGEGNFDACLCRPNAEKRGRCTHVLSAHERARERGRG
jgi:hypothetical protein